VVMPAPPTLGLKNALQKRTLFPYFFFYSLWCKMLSLSLFI